MMMMTSTKLWIRSIFDACGDRGGWYGAASNDGKVPQSAWDSNQQKLLFAALKYFWWYGAAVDGMVPQVSDRSHNLRHHTIPLYIQLRRR